MTSADGETVDQDLVALRAGTVLPACGEHPAHPPHAAGPQVPPGAESLVDYRFALPRAEPAVAGTSAPDLAAAIEELSGGALRCVPLSSGAWDGGIVEALVDRARSIDARLIANIRTGRLWGSRPPAELLVAWLDGDDLPEHPPDADWDVGHFVELAALVRGRARGQALIVVRDSYPTLGWDGHHLQPPDVVAAALRRDDGHGGGVLAVVPGERADEAIALAAELGLDIEMWDNGTRR